MGSWSRSRPSASIDILRETWSTYLDPSQNPPEIRPWGSKCIINACKEYKYIKTFSKRTKLSKAAYDKVVKRWQEYGLPGKAPSISIFGAPNVRPMCAPSSASVMILAACSSALEGMQPTFRHTPPSVE